jgi:hypothetical protein
MLSIIKIGLLKIILRIKKNWKIFW